MRHESERIDHLEHLKWIAATDRYRLPRTLNTTPVDRCALSRDRHGEDLPHFRQAPPSHMPAFLSHAARWHRPRRVLRGPSMYRAAVDDSHYYILQ